MVGIVGGGEVGVEKRGRRVVGGRGRRNVLARGRSRNMRMSRMVCEGMGWCGKVWDVCEGSGEGEDEVLVGKMRIVCGVGGI